MFHKGKYRLTKNIKNGNMSCQKKGNNKITILIKAQQQLDYFT